VFQALGAQGAASTRSSGIANGTIEQTKNEFESFNELGCRLS
jgi:hypothetical protein